MDLELTGEVFANRYRVERVLGRGGMGIVFAARHPILDQSVAIKLLVGDVANDDDLRRRFVNEARASALIENEHVVRVFDIATLANGQPYIVMEHLEGQDLARVLREHERLPYAEAVDYVMQALCAVAAAHLQGIVHRDLKPSNLFRADRRDRSRIIKVLDFGISKVTRRHRDGDEMDHGTETTTDALLGSPTYMSPEQARSTKLVDGRTDIWSIGVVLYELIAGARPFVGANVGQIIVSVLESDPPALNAFVADVPSELSGIIRRCLEKDASKRYANASDLALALAPFSTNNAKGALERILSMATTTSPCRPRQTEVLEDDVTPLPLESTLLATSTSHVHPEPRKKRPVLFGVAIGALVTTMVTTAVALSAARHNEADEDRRGASGQPAAAASPGIATVPFFTMTEAPVVVVVAADAPVKRNAIRAPLLAPPRASASAAPAPPPPPTVSDSDITRVRSE